ncbi:MAG: hypothetical protein IJV22_00855 [Bacteroidales bacterium]|nr:hypothetical protein [Bacteroidales bacterium]
MQNSQSKRADAVRHQPPCRTASCTVPNLSNDTLAVESILFRTAHRPISQAIMSDAVQHRPFFSTAPAQQNTEA